MLCGLLKKNGLNTIKNDIVREIYTSYYGRLYFVGGYYYDL